MSSWQSQRPEMSSHSQEHLGKKWWVNKYTSKNCVGQTSIVIVSLFQQAEKPYDILLEMLGDGNFLTSDGKIFPVNQLSMHPEDQDDPELVAALLREGKYVPDTSSAEKEEEEEVDDTDSEKESEESDDDDNKEGYDGAGAHDDDEDDKTDDNPDEDDNEGGNGTADDKVGDDDGDMGDKATEDGDMGDKASEDGDKGKAGDKDEVVSCTCSILFCIHDKHKISSHYFR